MSFLSAQFPPCKPPVWAKSGHAQTIWGHLLPSPQLERPTQTWEIPVNGGDRLLAHIFEPIGKPQPLVVYLFHGLGGDAHADYMRRTALVATELGATAVLVNHRGCGESQGIARHPYHSGKSEDLSRVLEEGKNRFNGYQSLAAGFSLSANALLLLLGSSGYCLPDYALAVNAPINLRAASRKLREGLNRIYDLRFVHRCRNALIARQNAGFEKSHYSIPRWASIWDFDEIYTAPAAGFENREDYYRRASANQVIPKITTPTWMITAKDDPFIDYRDYVKLQLPLQVKLQLETYGGHVGYLNRRGPWGYSRWLDEMFKTALKPLLSLSKNVLVKSNAQNTPPDSVGDIVYE